MSDGYSIHFHCWQPDTFLEFFVAVREKFGLDFELLAFAPPENEDDVEFIVVLAKGRTTVSGCRRARRLRLRDAVLHSRLGPPLRALRRATKITRK